MVGLFIVNSIMKGQINITSKIAMISIAVGFSIALHAVEPLMSTGKKGRTTKEQDAIL